MKKTLLDTNIIIRYIVNDDEKQKEEIRRVVEMGGSMVLDMSILETLFVLTGHYGIERDLAAKSVLRLLAVTETENTEISKTALIYFVETKMDYVDCLLLARSIQNDDQIITFDKQLRKWLIRKGAIDCTKGRMYEN